ncbi:MAG: hypothetical protein NTV79_11610, partial [Candidatus Aureabacteria bacterium]|nr:hypothetical protein [Candidatus Auribacterota bacterium]
GFSSILCGLETINRPSGALGIMGIPYPGAKAPGYFRMPFQGMERFHAFDHFFNTTYHAAFNAPEGRSIIARGFTPWNREKNKSGALKGRLIIYAYPEISPHKMEENRN